MNQPVKPNSAVMIQRRVDVSIVEFLDVNVLNPVTIERIKQELEEHIIRVGQPKIIVSFENVKHLSSAMIGVITALHKKIAAAKGDLRLAHVSPMIMEVLKLTRLDKILKIFETTDRALVKF